MIYYRRLVVVDWNNVALFVLAGFVAQMVDGTLGMAYGVSATAFLLAIGVPPQVASASVHAAEVVTTGVSGLSHHTFGNTDRYLIKHLLLPGVVGAAAGAFVLVSSPADTVRPLVSAYLLVMGGVIVLKAVRSSVPLNVRSHIAPLGLVGGFLDAAGGGGWGPIVTTTLIARGNHPRFAIGSVNAVEFFVALSAAVTFALTIGLSHWPAIVGLALGGAVAAPLAAWLARCVPVRPLMLLVGGLVMLLSARTIGQALGWL